MNGHYSDAAETKPPILSSKEIDELLSMMLIANLATIDEDGSIHLPMWFLRVENDICIPTSASRHPIIRISTGVFERGHVHQS